MPHLACAHPKRFLVFLLAIHLWWPVVEAPAPGNSSVRVFWGDVAWENVRGQISLAAHVENIEDNNDLFFNAAPVPLGAARPNILMPGGNLPPRVAVLSMELMF